MALIKCKECGHEASDKASACPNCGCPMGPMENVGATQEEVIHEEPKKKKGWILALIVALLCLIGGGRYYAYSKFDDVGSDKDAIVELTPEFIKNIEKYDILCIFSEGLAAVSKDNKWGYINTKGQEVIPTKIDAYCVGRFSEGLAFVAKEKDKEDFSIIDIKGNIIFEGKGFYYSYYYPSCEEMPYFIDGKIYVPTLNDKYQVYDTKGTKLEVVNSKIGDSVYRQHEGAKYSVFYEDLSVSENIDIGITKCGLKDSVGNVIISAKYDVIGNKEWFDAEVDNEYQYNACVSNGVVLVVLDELNEDFYVELESKKVRHYGYADLKGNDTFTEHLKSLCQEAEKKAIQKKIEEVQGEFEENYNASTTNNNIDMTIHFTYGQHKNESGFLRLHTHDKGSWPPIKTAYSQLGNAYICSTNIEIDEGKTYMFLGYEVEDGKSKVMGLYYSKSNELVAAHSLSKNDGQAVILMPGKYYFTVVARIPEMYDEGDATCKVNLHFVEQSY